MTNSKNSRGTDAPGRQQQDNTRSGKPSGKSSQPANKEPRSGEEEMPDPDEEPVTESGSDIDPDRNIQIDDDPEQTKRKIPQMRR